MSTSTSLVTLRPWRTNVVVIGSGVAGLACALALAPVPVTLITKTARPESGSSVWAKGGVAAAVGDDDAPALHADDTVGAGAGLCDRELCLLLAEEGAAVVRALAEAGAPFDRAADGSLALGREAAHSRHRIVHAGGDATGSLLVAALLEQVARTPSIHVLSECFALDLIVQNGRVRGLTAVSREHGWMQVLAGRVVLASGGVGSLWRDTTNPPENTGDGLAMAMRAGAIAADLEFMQFHPTALVPKRWRAGEPLPLLTEALRGAGATVLDSDHRRFMEREHPLAELAPRDVVARAIARRTARGEPVLLDMRPAIAARGVEAFPQAIAQATAAGYDPFAEPVPVAAAAHYHMGGVLTDASGRSSVEGLWACGEVACTGVHGANRLASNSLLEGLVFGQRVAADILASNRGDGRASEPLDPCREAIAPVDPAVVAASRAALRGTMSEHVGIVRTGEGLGHAQSALIALDVEFHEPAAGARADAPAFDFAAVRSWGEVRNMLLAAQLVVHAALGRTESRGAHFRLDHPETKAEWARRQRLTAADVKRAREDAPKRSAATAT